VTALSETLAAEMEQNAFKNVSNGTSRFKKCKQLFEYQQKR